MDLMDTGVSNRIHEIDLNQRHYDNIASEIYNIDVDLLDDEWYCWK